MISITLILLALLLGIVIAEWQLQREREKAVIKLLHRDYYSNIKLSEKLFKEMKEDPLYKQS